MGILVLSSTMATILAALKTDKGRYAAGHERVRTYHEPDNRVVDSSGDRWTWAETAGKGRIDQCIDGRRERMMKNEMV